MVKKLILAAVALFVGLAATVAQQQLPVGQNYYNEGSTGIVYDRELAFDFQLITPRSFGLGVSIGQIRSYYLTRFYHIGLSDLRHPREYRQSFDFQLPNLNRVSGPFIFGKQNQFYVLRAGIGEKRYFSEKARRRGLAVGISYAGGVSLGLLKPYYLDLIYLRDQGTSQPIVRTERYSPENAQTFLDIYSVLGAAPFSRGLGEIQARPGFHAKFAAHFDWGAFDEFVKAIEAGVMLDFFLSEIPIMVESNLTSGINNSPAFFNFYLNLQLGKRR